MSPTALPSARLPSTRARTSRPRRAPDMARTRARTPRPSVPVTIAAEASEASEAAGVTTSAASAEWTSAVPGTVSGRPGDTGSASRTTRSATDSRAGRCTTSRTVRPTASRRTASTTSASVEPSSAAVGSSSSSTGRSARNARASASRCRCPADSPAPSSPRAVSAPCGSASTNSSAPASSKARRTAGSSASGRERRTFSAIVPANRCGRCGTHAIRARHCSRSASARSTPPARTRPSLGRTKPRSTFSSVDLPAPLGPTSATVSPGSTVNDTSDTASPDRSAKRTVTPSKDRGPVDTGAEPACGTGVSSTEKISSAAASPSAAAWYWAPTWRSGRYASGASTRMTRPMYRSMSPWTSLMPIVTATRATESVASSSSAKEEMNAIRRVRMVACRYSPVMRRIESACALARPNTFRVGRPATTSRKCPDSRDSSCH